MCGITAISTQKEALPFLMQGLEKLEYRGYDSAGVTILNQQELKTVKTKGRLEDLNQVLSSMNMQGHVGIGHTRWATHGIPSDINSHPHHNHDNTISIVHNGIIENYRELKRFLLDKGYHFQSETDSEVIVHLLDYYNQGDILKALQKVKSSLVGSYALCIVSKDCPSSVIMTRKDSPIVLGKNNEGTFGASDIPALLDYTNEVYFLDNGDIAILAPTHIEFYDEQLNVIQKESQFVPYDRQAAQKEGFDTFMQKEIHEQPHAIKETLRNRIHDHKVYLEELNDVDFTQFNKAYFIACGTAYHACLSGAFFFEKMSKIPTITQVASEFRYNDVMMDENTLCIFVSQSGETADTLAALRLAKSHYATSIAITNVLGSSLSREANHTLYTYAGPEISVASTKAYTTQLVLLTLFGVYVSQHLNQISHQDILLNQLENLPHDIENILKDESIFESYAHYLKEERDAYFIGRNLDYVAMLEGALKLKEVSYVHADAYQAGELKHGPIALIENGTVVFAVALQPHIALKTMSNIQETIARGANVILFTNSDMEKTNATETYVLPNIHPFLQTILVAIPLQCIAYYTAKLKGCDVDKPRNLAKSVTVE